MNFVTVNTIKVFQNNLEIKQIRHYNYTIL